MVLAPTEQAVVPELVQLINRAYRLGEAGLWREDDAGRVGRALVDAAEDRARSRGARTMKLELLIPRAGTHPDKERLHAWYTRRGYTVVERVPFEEYVPHAAPMLTAPGHVLGFNKSLR